MLAQEPDSKFHAFKQAKMRGETPTPLEELDPEDIELAWMLFEETLEQSRENLLRFNNRLWTSSGWSIMYVLGLHREITRRHVANLLADGSLAQTVAGMSEVEMYNYLFNTPNLVSFRFSLMRHFTGGPDWIDRLFPVRGESAA